MEYLLVLLLLALQGGTGSIEGTVSHSLTKEPVVGAQVGLTKVLRQGSPPSADATSPPRQTVFTDAQGKFALRNIPPDSYRVVVERDGFVSQEYGSRQPGRAASGTVLDVVGGDSHKGIDVRLVPTGSVNGRVSGANRRPLTGMYVTLLRATYDSNGIRTFQIAGAAQTDDLGNYRLYWLTPGRYYLTAGPSPLDNSSSAGTVGQKQVTTFFPGVTDATMAVTIEVKSGQDLNGIDVAVQQIPTFSIRGRVAGLQLGVGASSLSISPRQPLPSNIRVPPSTVPSNSDGSFELKDVLPGQYWVRAQPGPNSPGAVAAVDVVANDVENVSLTVMPAASITGRVTLDGRSLPADAIITIFFSPLAVQDRFAPSPPASVVNADGAFIQSYIAPGEYELSVRGLTSNLYVKDARFGAVDVLGGPLRFTGLVPGPLNIDLHEGGQLGGVVRDSQQVAIARASVVLVPDIRRDRRHLFNAATSDAMGRFTIGGIPPGDYKLFAWEGLEPYSYFNADVMRAYESKGTPIHISEWSKQNADVGIIRSEAQP